MSNLQLAKLLRAVSAAISLGKGDNKFRVIAYDRAADAIEHASSEVKDLWDNHNLDALPGIGASIAASLDELFRTGKVKHFEQILSKYSPALFELLEVPGIGPKTAYKLTEALGIRKAHSAVSDLEKAAKKGRIRGLEGMGEESERNIIQSIQEYRGRTRRLLLPQATAIAEDVMKWVGKHPSVRRVDPLGSLRRQASTVGDIDISAASKDPKGVIEHFLKYPRNSRTLDAGERTASFLLPNEYRVDIKVQPPEAYGSLLQHFTGSKHHNVTLREQALKKGYSLSEYGIKTGEKITQFATEEEFYEFLGLQWVPPELREDVGEIEAARLHQIPQLVELKDIKGDLQIHSDIDVEPSHDLGQSSIAEIIAVATQLGYEYIGFTEHNPSVAGHTAEKIIDIIKRKTDIIEEYNYSRGHGKDKRIPYVFNGLEIDILPDGKLPVPDAGLDLLDYACVSIHSSFKQSRKVMTDRVITALQHPKVRFFAHPTGRLLGEREGVDLDWDRIFEYCLKNDKWLEIDGWPNRLDLPDTIAKDAIQAGVKLVIDTDSHAADQLPYMRYGVSVARRGWAKSVDIMNTLSLDKFQKVLLKEVNNK